MAIKMQAPYSGGALLSCCRHARTCCVYRSVGRSAAVVPFSSLTSPSSPDSSFDQLKEAAPSLLKERLSFRNETGFLNPFSTNSNHHSTALANIENDIDKLEHVLIQSEKEIYGSDPYPDAVWEAQSQFDILQEELCRLQTLLDSKDNSLKVSLQEATVLKTHLQNSLAQAGSLSLFKEAYEARQAEELSRLGRMALDNLEILDEHLMVNKAVSNSVEKIQKVWESIIFFHSSSASLKLIGILQREASLYCQALVMVTEELEQEKTLSSNTLLKLQTLADDYKEKDLEINRLQQDLARVNKKCDVISKELAKAGAEVSSLHQKVINTEGLLDKERKSLRAARDGLEELDCALGNEESKVDDLFKEVSSLKVQLEQKETTVQSLRNEALKNKGLQEIARKHLSAFHQSEKKVQQLMAGCNALESQIRSKDLLLEDIKKEAFDRTEALRLAAQIKQDLNSSRHREIQLTQELERERLQVKDLGRELMENSRVVKAELALRQAEKNVVDLNRELALLRNGIQSRDDVIKLMQEKIDGNIQILQSASNDREAMRKMEDRIHSLESRLKEFL